MRRLRLPGFCDCRDRVLGQPPTADAVVPGGVVGNEPKNGLSAVDLQRVLGLKSYKTAWTPLHKLRHAMVRPGPDRLQGCVKVDEAFIGGEEAGGGRGRQTETKAMIAIGVEEDGGGIGRIRMRRILDASAESLMPFIKDSVELDSVVHTDGWRGYQPVEGEAIGTGPPF